MRNNLLFEEGFKMYFKILFQTKSARSCLKTIMLDFCYLQFAFAFHDCEFLQNSSSERGQELAITAHALRGTQMTQFNLFNRANN